MGGGGPGGPTRHDRRAAGHDPTGPGHRGGRPAMNISLGSAPLATAKVDAIVVGVYADDKKLREPAARVNAAAGGVIADVLAVEKFQGKAGHVTHVHTNGRLAAPRVVVVGLGKRAETTAETMRRAAAAGLRRARDLGARSVAIEVLGDRLPARQ